MMIMNKKFALMVLSIVAIAGCTAQPATTTTGGGLGLSISEFSLNPAEARQDQTVLAKMVIENDGQFDVSKDDYFSLLIKPTDWSFTGTEQSAVKTANAPMRRATGDQKPVPRTFTWSMAAPKSKGIDTPTDFTGRIYYNFQTEASGTVNVYPSSEAERATDKAEFTSSKGPLEIAVEVNPNPPVVYSLNDEFTLTIHFKNKGTGVVFANGTSTSADYTIAESNLGKVTVPIPTLPAGLEWSDSSCFDNVQFFGTSKEEITTCAVKVNQTLAAKTPYRISIKAFYGYYDEAKARVILKAR